MPPTPPTPTIPCAICTKVLPENASLTPLSGHGVCSCCGCYYPSLLIRQKHPFCAACAPPVPAPSRPTASSDSNSQVSVCTECKTHVKHSPPADGVGFECQCCWMGFDRSSFSTKQVHLRIRRCKSCMASMFTPDKFVRKKGEGTQYAADQQRRRDKMARLRAARLAGESTKGKLKKQLLKATANIPSIAPSPTQPSAAAATQQLATSAQALVPPGVSQASPQERHEMEVDVRNIKLARRSIHRRRRANDLRGSTRLEYEAQLGVEEDKVNKTMARIRRRNPALFDWVDQGLEIKGALGIAPRDWDHPMKGKQQKQSSHKHKWKRPAMKRTENGVAESRSSPAKRARVSGAGSSDDTKP